MTAIKYDCFKLASDWQPAKSRHCKHSKKQAAKVARRIMIVILLLASSSTWLLIDGLLLLLLARSALHLASMMPSLASQGCGYASSLQFAVTADVRPSTDVLNLSSYLLLLILEPDNDEIKKRTEILAPSSYTPLLLNIQQYHSIQGDKNQSRNNNNNNNNKQQ